jgi:Mycobacterium membrane protein
VKLKNRRQYGQFHIRDIARKCWTWIVVVTVLTSAVLFVGAMRHHGLDDASVVHSAPAVAMGTPAQTTVVYTVKGPDGAGVTLAYLQPEGPVRRVVAHLPWSVSVQTRSLAPAASVLAASVAGPISCEISVDGSTVIARQSQSDSSPVDCTLPTV